MRSLTSFVVLGGALSLCTGCLVPVEETRSTVIGPAGGVVTNSAGVRVEVPPKAVAAPVAIGIDVSPREGPARFRAVGSAWLLTPEDTRFAVPVTVSLPLPADYSAVAPLVMLSSPAGAERFEALPTVRRGDVVSARTSHFSVFVAGHQYAADAAPDAGVPADGG